MSAGLYKSWIFPQPLVMNLDLSLLLRALGLALVFEGLCWALAPGGMRKLMRLLLNEADDALRAAGLLALATGLFLVWFATWLCRF